MTEAAEASDIQEDFCIKLNEYPILTKFSTTGLYKTKEFVDMFERLVPGGNHFKFRIELAPDGNIIVTPLLSVPSDIIDNYRGNPEFFSAYISFQLTNSGILPSIAEIISSGNQVTIALRVISRPKRDFSYSFFNFHKDQTIFTMLQYYNFDEPFVFGTEVLLGYEEEEINLPHELLGVLPLTEKVGNLSNAFSTISAVNSELKNSGVRAVILRGKYNNGDTMTFSDPLLRHATIKPDDYRGSNAIEISIPKKGQFSSYNVGTNKATVKVCSLREPTTPEMVDNRQAIAMFLFIDTENYAYTPPSKFGVPFTIPQTPARAIKTINFNKDQFKGFVETLSSGEGCVAIDGVTITSRGGKRTKPNRRKKTNKKKKTIKKKRTAKKNKMNKRKTKKNKN